MANLELGVRITPASVFGAASISKQFTAMSILLLGERGQLSLDDDVSRYVPNWLDREHHITIRHLLTHTSGLRDGFALLGWAGPSDVSPNEAITPMLARQRGVNFEPGHEYQYNNGAYNLLGRIVNVVSGQSLRAFADANIFKPLGMTSTHYRDDPAILLPNRVSGYSQDTTGFHPASEAVGVVGNAGVYTTVGDLLLWEQNLTDARVGSRTDIDSMQRPTTLIGGGTSAYGYGLAIGEYRGMRTVEHAGGDRGIATNAVRYPDRQLAVVVLCNLDTIDVTRLTHGVTDIFIADAPTSAGRGAEAVPQSEVSLSPGDLAAKPGLYRSSTSTDRVMRVSVDGKTLLARSLYGDDTDLQLSPVAADRFRMPGTSNMLVFRAPNGTQPQGWFVANADGRPLASFDLVTYSPLIKDLQSLVGDYHSPEIEVTYRLTLNGSILEVRAPGRPVIAIQPVAKDVFAGDSVGVVKVFRDARGAVLGFSLNRDNARGVRFVRVGWAG